MFNRKNGTWYNILLIFRRCSPVFVKLYSRPACDLLVGVGRVHIAKECRDLGGRGGREGSHTYTHTQRGVSLFDGLF